MSRLITKFKYLKPEDRKNVGGYAEYIATREGVEKIDESKRNAPATNKQSLAEGRTAYLPHGGCQYFCGCGSGCCDEYLCFGKTEAHASRCKIRNGHHQPFHASIIWII